MSDIIERLQSWKSATSEDAIAEIKRLRSTVAGLTDRCDRLEKDREYNAELVTAERRKVEALEDCKRACEEFVAKVERGEARSRRSYEQMKAAIARAIGALEER
jgi:hypothetical protein